MNRRLGLAVVAVVLLLSTAGCLSYVTGGGEVSDERLDREPAQPYSWDTDRDAQLTLHTTDEVQAIYRVDADQRLRLYQSTGLGTEGPLDISAVRFQYANGTVISGTELRDTPDGEVEQTPDEVYVTAPADGQLAFSADATPRRLSLPVYVEGSYEVILPEDYRIDFFLFGNTAPRGAASEIVDNQVHVRWAEVTGPMVVVQYYLDRDLYVFGGAVVLLSLIGVGGLYYYRRQIDRLHDVRVQMGLDTEEDDDKK
ncbi:hypothetical protein halTADL_3076 [Halohasta litchfieldiae]|jgi:hypothetical protein|uniref:Lipoprotein n=1 Tax=Halohasta litchfieldiae TaxID=1073996 RepID=A0A1H6RAL1_9EURY|nr:DUF5803 family protein [Halohasta litchfieldiae]ATW89778.1 hypothetical protein halTADL_3076 [Halohasta litchfieldiae]SEI52851.1 hypothetical protein SAMN05444271_10248 [Halohasta litchfieldiae]